MIIRNNTLYDKDLILKYNKYFLTTYLKRNFLIMSSISLVFIIYMLVIKRWEYALILLGILLFYLVLTYFMQKVTTSRILKKSPLVEEPVLQTYEFREEDFDIINVKKYVLKYTDLLKYKKGSEFYILYSRDKRTFIVNFNGFENKKDVDFFGEFIKEKLSKK